jgi:REP element-mobilizing transposase RayT
MDKISEKKHRLPREFYIGQVKSVFTICLQNKKEFFTAKDIFEQIKKILLNVLKKFNCEAHIYYFMPDHCHFLLEGTQEFSDLYKCVVEFKQRSGYWFSQSGFNVKWQKDFYDHILRKDEDVVKQVKYILENAQRKGLVKDWREYPFKGSTLHNFDEWAWV